MKRALTKLSALCLICLMLLSACGAKVLPVSGGPSAEDKVYGNGGLTVVKGDYVFFINGTSSTTADNKYGTPVKGAIVRQNLNDPDDRVVVVKKVVLSSYSKGGFYIFGDKIYFASPSVEKDYDGNVLTSSLDFFSVKLDGTELTSIKFVASNSAAYKFYQNPENGNVHFVYVSGTEVYSLNTATKTELKIGDEISGTPLLADDGYVYYTKNLYKQESEDEDKELLPYAGFKRAGVFGSAEEELAFANGTPIINSSVPVDKPEESVPTDKIALLDVKVFDDNTVLFYTRQSVVVDTNPILIPNPYTVSYTIGDTHEKPVDTGGSGMFTDRFYLSPTSYIGADSSNSWLFYVSHEYRQVTQDSSKETGESNPMSGWYVKFNAVPIMMEKPSKILFAQGDNFYYLNGSNILCIKQYKGEGLSGEFEAKGEEVIKDVSISTSMLMPELVTSGDNMYLYFVRSNGYYPNYVYRLLIGGDTEEGSLKAEFVGIATEADEETAQKSREADEEDDITDKT